MALQYWNEKAISHYHVPIDVMDSTIYVYRSIKEKYAELENVMKDEEILADLKNIIIYYPLLGKICLEQGTKNIAKGIDDIDIPEISDNAQELIKENDYNPTAAFVAANGSDIAVEILNNFYLMNENKMIDNSFLSAVNDNNIKFVKFLISSYHHISYSVLAAVLKNATDEVRSILSS